MSTDVSLTPLMRQYFDIKNKFPDALVFFQVGDFYELFFADAQKASHFLGIVLTQRGMMGNEPIPLCGVPRHTVEHYLVKLVKGGFRVVICDQLESPQPGKLVERGVTQVFTPGTLVDTTLLDSKSPHYISAVIIHEGTVALAFYEMLAATIYLTSFTYDEKKVESELASFMPQEVLLESTATGKQLEGWCRQRMFVTTSVNEPFLPTEYEQWIKSCQRFTGTSTALTPAQEQALSLLGAYLKKNAPYSFETEKVLFIYESDHFLQLDAATQHNLELVESRSAQSRHERSSCYTLVEVLDAAVTGMGSRLLKKWLLRPLIDRVQIEQRLERVAFFVAHTRQREMARELLKQIGDLERIVGRIALNRAPINDYRNLTQALQLLPALDSLCTVNAPFFTPLFSLLSRALSSDTRSEYMIAGGFHEELDRLRDLATHGIQRIFELERAEQERSGINTLKIRYSQAAGYAIEITKAQSGNVPADYIKLQSLTNRDRFTTQALKDLEYDINRAQSMSNELEQKLFAEVVREVQRYAAPLQKVARHCAELDALTALATVAVEQAWVRPTLTSDETLNIQDGRHPILEYHLRRAGSSATFVPNSVRLDVHTKTWIITGPNMGGKSTFLRQTALICILAHMGSFVPAACATIPLLDRIFTRIGAGDHLAQGKSTFLVEMEETALICEYATARSLVILDEVGRGTSTYDGLSLAQAIVEYLEGERKPFCLFATHYHELTHVAQLRSTIVCYHAASKTVGETVVLSHKIIPGVAQGSFGIQVARAARVPAPIIARARVLLEQYSSMPYGHTQQGNNKQAPGVLDYSKTQQVLDELDLESISPRQAYDILCKLKEL